MNDGMTFGCATTLAALAALLTVAAASSAPRVLSAQGVTAAAPAPPTFKACYAGDKTGTVYRIDDPAYPAPGGYPASSKNATGCAGPKDQPFTWNQVGPIGLAGPAGPAGPQGAAGPAGIVGPDVSVSGSGSFGGQLTVQGNITSNAGSLQLTQGSIGAAGTITAQGDIVSNAGSLRLTNGSIGAAGSITAQGDIISNIGDLRLTAGSISAAGNVTVQGDILSNVGSLRLTQGGITAAGTASVGSLATTGDATVGGTATVNNLVVNGTVSGATLAVSGYQAVTLDFNTGPGVGYYNLYCPVGKRAMGYGFDAASNWSVMQIAQAYPINDYNRGGYYISVNNATGGYLTIKLFINCVTAT